MACAGRVRRAHWRNVRADDCPWSGRNPGAFGSVAGSKACTECRRLPLGRRQRAMGRASSCSQWRSCRYVDHRGRCSVEPLRRDASRCESSRPWRTGLQGTTTAAPGLRPWTVRARAPDPGPRGAIQCAHDHRCQRRFQRHRRTNITGPRANAQRGAVSWLRESLELVGLAGRSR
jgi:hypothetical protein